MSKKLTRWACKTIFLRSNSKNLVWRTVIAPDIHELDIAIGFSQKRQILFLIFHKNQNSFLHNLKISTRISKKAGSNVQRVNSWWRATAPNMYFLVYLFHKGTDTIMYRACHLTLNRCTYPSHIGFRLGVTKAKVSVGSADESDLPSQFRKDKQHWFNDLSISAESAILLVFWTRSLKNSNNTKPEDVEVNNENFIMCSVYM